LQAGLSDGQTVLSEVVPISYQEFVGFFDAILFTVGSPGIGI